MRPSRVVTHLSPEELDARDPVIPRVAAMLRPYRRQITLVLVAVIGIWRTQRSRSIRMRRMQEKYA